jgi:hypothetical protein
MNTPHAGGFLALVGFFAATIVVNNGQTGRLCEASGYLALNNR